MTDLERQSPLYRGWIKREYLARKERNSAYSIRAFARSLGVNKTTLAAVLAGKRHFAKATALKVADQLALSPRQKKQLLQEIRSRETKRFFEDVQNRGPDVEFLQLQEDEFKLISDWYYIGILTLAQLRDHKAEPQWIARKLGISEQQAGDALAALIRLKLIAVRSRRLVRTTLPIKTTHQIPSPAIRKYHKQNLRMAEQSLEYDPTDRRLFGAISVPIHPDDLKTVDEMIQRFKLQIGEIAGTKSATDVYTLSIQFFPLTKQGAT